MKGIKLVVMLTLTTLNLCSAQFTTPGNIINSNPANGFIGLTGDLPGYASGLYPTLKSGGTLYLSVSNKYSGYITGSTDASIGLNDTNFNTKVVLHTNGNSYLNGGNVGIGIGSPLSRLHVADGVGGEQIRLSRGTGSIRFAQDMNVDDLYLSNSDASKTYMFWKVDGNVGIGTITPSSKLEVTGNIVNSNPQNGWIGLTGDLPGYTSGLYPTLKSNGTLYFSVSNKYSGYISGSADASFGLNDTNVNTRVILNTNGNSYLNGGNVGIGTTSPDAKLAVKGQIHAQEVKVDLNIPGPDYVFEKDYQLTSLEEIKNYINQNKHLPEVPSAKEMEKNGVQLGEMNMLLLKKIEELTLYVIEQNKLILKHNERITILENKK